MDKIRENRLRRAAERQGMRFTKSRRRDPRATDYGKFFLSKNNFLVSPEEGMDLDGIEAYLGGGPEIAVQPRDRLDYSFEDSRGKPIIAFEGISNGAPTWRLFYETTEGSTDDYVIVAPEDNQDWALQQAREHLLRYGYTAKSGR